MTIFLTQWFRNGTQTLDIFVFISSGWKQRNLHRSRQFVDGQTKAVRSTNRCPEKTATICGFLKGVWCEYASITIIHITPLSVNISAGITCSQSNN